MFLHLFILGFPFIYHLSVLNVKATVPNFHLNTPLFFSSPHHQLRMNLKSPVYCLTAASQNILSLS